MQIKQNHSYAIVNTDVLGINNKEMRQMFELNLRIIEVLNSHKPEAKEKRYIGDEDLKLMHAILSTFTVEFESTQTSAFDEFLAELAEQSKTCLTDDDLFGGDE